MKKPTQKKPRARRPMTLAQEAGDVERMHTIAKALDAMGTERSRLLSLAFFVNRYDQASADRLYALCREELEKLRRPGHDF